jgi:2-polyprenyl-6-methoxyphenol hydroxylase-like FAD-dependent oxidoreductase
MQFMNIKQTMQGNQHAVVIGASMAGLVAARVLSDYFEQVTVIERDQLPDQVEARKGVPQGQHAHAVLAKGADALSELFPGLFEALTQDGAIRFAVADMKQYQSGAWNERFPIPIHLYSQSRPFLEQYVRDFLAARGNVRLLATCQVTRLLATEDSSRITGVSLHYRDGEQREEELAADLVVDTSGRGSRAPQWLVSLGYPQVEETKVKVHIGYASRIYRRPSHLPIDWKVLMIFDERRAGVAFSMEGDCWMVTLVTLRYDEPLPNDESSFLEHARSLSQPDLYEAIKEAEPLTPVLNYKYSANRWRRYERMPRFPEGFVILGDAVCNFNPIYGQGMTVAALEAKVLDACLRQRSQSSSKQESGFAQQYQKAIAKVVKWPWQMATGGDYSGSEMEGKQALSTRMLKWYMTRLMPQVATNPVAAERFHQVQNMLKTPTVLFDTRLVWTVLRQELVSRWQKPAVSLPLNESDPQTLANKLDAIVK